MIEGKQTETLDEEGLEASRSQIGIMIGRSTPVMYENDLL